MRPCATRRHAPPERKQLDEEAHIRLGNGTTNLIGMGLIVEPRTQDLGTGGQEGSSVTSASCASGVDAATMAAARA